jgi:hypothetical protein
MKNSEAILLIHTPTGSVTSALEDSIQKEKKKWHALGYEIKRVKTFSSNDPFGEIWQEVIDMASSESLFIAVTHFAILPNKPEIFEVLRQSEVDFMIMDYASLNQDGLKVLIDFLKIQSTEKSKSIVEGLEKKKAQGHKLGNPNITDKTVQEPAKMMRRLLAFRNPNNVNARRRLVELLEKEGRELNFSQLAQELNEDGYKTRRGKKFQAKSVQRLYDSVSEIRSMFSPNEKYEPLVLAGDNLIGRKNSDAPTIGPIPLNTVAFENNLLVIRFEKILNQEVHITIANNKDAVIYEEAIGGRKMEYRIDLLNDYKFLPGLYYIRLISPGYESFFEELLVMEELLV